MSSAAVANPGDDATKTHQISIPLPRSLDTRLYIHLTVRPKSILLMVTTASADEATTPTPLGSFVYAIPDVCFCFHPRVLFNLRPEPFFLSWFLLLSFSKDPSETETPPHPQLKYKQDKVFSLTPKKKRFNPSQPLCTPLMTVEPTLEFATRLARLVAKRSGLPTYVGNSVSLMSAGMGGTADEEMEAFRAVVDAVVASLALTSANGAV